MLPRSGFKARIQSAAGRYGLPLALAAVASLAGVVLTPWLGQLAPFTLLYIALVLTWCFAGLGPALVGFCLGFVPGAIVLARGPGPEPFVPLGLYFSGGLTLVFCLDLLSRRHREAGLRAGEERFRLLATEAPVGIFQTDPRGDCVFVNDRW